MVQNEITARAGAYKNRQEALATRLALHDAKYCTKDQAEVGLCSAEAPRAGRSLMASVLFEPSQLGDAVYQDKSAFINNMMGLPNDPVGQEYANTALGIAYQDKVRQKDSIKSVAANALKFIQAYFSQVDAQNSAEGTHSPDTTIATTEYQQMQAASDVAVKPNTDDLEDLSLTGSMQKDVGRFFGGGDAYLNRRKYLAAATEKGVLVELNRGAAFELVQLETLIEQERMNAALTAAQTAALIQTGGLSSAVNKKRQEIVQANARAAAAR